MSRFSVFDCIAEGSEPNQRWKHVLSEGRTYVLGRGVDVDLPVPWDPAISRRHVLISVSADRVKVESAVSRGRSCRTLRAAQR
jgi:adenylate cyclase